MTAPAWIMALSDRVDNPVWDALWCAKPISRLAVAVAPNIDRVSRVRENNCIELDTVPEKPDRWTPEWEKALTDQCCDLLAASEVAGDHFTALTPPRFVHAQSQGIADIFGARVELMSDGLHFVHPLPSDSAMIDDIQPIPLQRSVYWGAVEWIRYARVATNSMVPFRCPVMTGPIDTCNYLLGTGVLMDWIYSEPDALHRLLSKVTDILVDMISALRASAGDQLHSHHFGCMRGGFDLCSEVRSLLSRETYEEYEAPYLRRIGERLGPYAIHSCGSWERTLPSAVADPNLRAMNGQIRENDLAALCQGAGGRIALSIGASANLDERYTWPDTASFLLHVISTVPDNQPCEVRISEDDLPLWSALHERIRGVPFTFQTPFSS